MQILEWNLTQLLKKKIYALSATFVKLYLNITNLYRFNHENLILQFL